MLRKKGQEKRPACDVKNSFYLVTNPYIIIFPNKFLEFDSFS